MKIGLKEISQIVALLTAIVCAIGSYYKAIYELGSKIDNSKSEIMQAVHDNYATKEETQYIQDMLKIIREDLREIKQNLISRGGKTWTSSSVTSR